MYKYETHLHTQPASRCAKASVEDNVKFYKDLGYEGMFITNHFLDGSSCNAKQLPYELGLEAFFSDVEEGKRIGNEIGIKVLSGLEMTYGGTDFLVYGLDIEWFLAHPEIMDMKKSEELPFLMENGALVVQAHPYREAKYIDHIRLFPRCVQGVEIDNACRTEFENEMAKKYAEAYGLLPFAGSDNHVCRKRPRLAGMEFDTPIADELDFVRRVKNGEGRLFTIENPLLPPQQN